MRKTVYKWFWAWNFDKEEQWLNEMAAKGLTLIAIGFCKYTFEESTPSEYEVRLELLENLPTHAESERYIQFVEETDAEYLGAIFRWVYFRKKKSTGAFDLYSDCSSRMKHLNRILSLIAVCSILNISNGINNLFLYFGMNATLANLWIGILCAAFGLLTGYGGIQIYSKRRELQKQSQLFEQ